MHSSIWPINGTLTDTSTPGKSEPESNGNEWALHIPETLKLEPRHHIICFNGISTLVGYSMQNPVYTYD